MLACDPKARPACSMGLRQTPGPRLQALHKARPPAGRRGDRVNFHPFLHIGIFMRNWVLEALPPEPRKRRLAPSSSCPQPPFLFQDQQRPPSSPLVAHDPGDCPTLVCAVRSQEVRRAPSSVSPPPTPRPPLAGGSTLRNA